jgi:hypothetical protein
MFDTGFWLLDAGCWLLAAGYRLLIIGLWLLVTSNRKLPTGSLVVDINSNFSKLLPVILTIQTI